MELRAVIFDLGGVVLDSPLHFISRFERARGLPENLVARVVGGYAARPDGPWQRLEKGELSVADFCEAFDEEIRKHGHEISTAEMMTEMADHTEIRPHMLRAIRRLREANLKVAALTNNWRSEDGTYRRMMQLRDEFDVFVESCKVGMRKPDPRIYELTLERLDVEPAEAAFLDDIGHNLKVPRAMGVVTIKVTDVASALDELGRAVGVDLSSPD